MLGERRHECRGWKLVERLECARHPQIGWRHNKTSTCTWRTASGERRSLLSCACVWNRIPWSQRSSGGVGGRPNVHHIHAERDVRGYLSRVRCWPPRRCPRRPVPTLRRRPRQGLHVLREGGECLGAMPTSTANGDDPSSSSRQSISRMTYTRTSHHRRTRRGRLAIFKNIESPVHGRSRPFEPPTKIEIAGR